MAKSKSTSDTCSRCGKRIDLCDKSTCPMSQQKKSKFDQIQDVLGRMQQLSSELWDLVEPTKAELTAIREQYMDDYGPHVTDDYLTTQSKDAWSVAIITCQDVLDYREEEAQNAAVPENGKRL